MTFRSLRIVPILLALAVPLALSDCALSGPAQPTLIPATQTVAPTPSPYLPPSATRTAEPPPASGPSPTVVPTPTLAASSMDGLVQSILDIISKGNQTDWLISQVSIPDQEMRGPLERTEQTMRQCWVREQGQTRTIPCQTLLETTKSEINTPRWKHGVAIFGIVSVERDYSRAVIRLDTAVGPMMGSGFLVTLVNQNGQWIEQSRDMVWIS